MRAEKLLMRRADNAGKLCHENYLRYKSTEPPRPITEDTYWYGKYTFELGRRMAFEEAAKLLAAKYRCPIILIK